MNQYHRVRSSSAEQAVGRAPVVLEAAARHRDGVSCQTTIAYAYNANGHERWCIDCGVELGEQEWHPDGADVPSRWVGLLLLLLGLILMTVILLVASWNGVFDSGPLPTSTPTTYGPPPTVVP